MRALPHRFNYRKKGDYAMDSMTLDFETCSEADLKKEGVHTYATHPSTHVLLAGYSINDAPERIIREGEPIPQEFIDAVDIGFKIRAWNAAFEYLIWTYVWGRTGGPAAPPAEQFECTMGLAG